MDRAEQMREAAAKIVDAEAARVLGLQDGKTPEVDANLRLMAVILPDLAAAIRALSPPPQPPLADDVAEVVERLRNTFVRDPAAFSVMKSAADLIERMAGELADWQKSQTYRYIGRDGKPVLARELEARAEKAEAEVARLTNLVTLAQSSCVMDRICWRHATLTPKGADHE
jgi:hypothetical protein